MTVLNVTRKPVTVIVQGRGLMGFKGDKGDPGNLTGPASSVNENIPIFDGIAGDKLKDSGVKLSDKADVDDMALKADITALETEKKLLMDEIDALKKASIENSNAPYLTVSDYGDVTLAKNSVGVGTIGVDGVTVENMVIHGDFDEGGPTLSTSYYTVSIENGTLKATVNALNTQSRIGFLNMTLLTDNVYLLQIKFKPKYNNDLALSIFGIGIQLVIGGLIANDWNMLTKKFTSNQTGTGFVFLYHSTATQYSIGDVLYCDEVKIINLTALGLASLTEAQLAKLLPVYFDSKKTFGGVGCLISKDSSDAEIGRMYFETGPMYSNATAKDVLAYDSGKYYHTHNVDSDGVAIAEPYDTEVETNGQIVCLSEGTVEYQPYFPDIGVYTDKFTLTKAITAVKELYKYGSETPIIDAVIAGDGLSFTSASLTAGDLAYGVFEFEEPLRPLMTIKSRNDDATVVDTSTGTVYTFRPVVTDGVIASWELTEV